MKAIEIAPDLLVVSAENSRKDLDAGEDDSGVAELAASIREKGLLSPLTVRPCSDGKYEVVAGQRRLLAWRSFSRDPIPCLLREDLDDADAAAISLIENVHRADMSPLDKARALGGLYERFGSYERVAKECAWSATTVAKYVALLELPETLLASLTTSSGSAGVGAMARLAKTFRGEAAMDVHDRIVGFTSRVQEEILRRSGGDLARIDDLVMEAHEGTFDARRCGGAFGCEVVRDIIDGRLSETEFDEIVGAVAQRVDSADFDPRVRAAAREFWKTLARS